MFALIDSGQPQIFIRSFARLLDESVQQYHPPLLSMYKSTRAIRF